MDFSIYQSATAKTAIYPRNWSIAIQYLTLGLASEAGEVAGKFKKAIRDESGEFSKERIDAISAEIGDVLWYCARLADEMGLDLNTIAKQNIDKLFARHDKGTLSGDGDNR